MRVRPSTMYGLSDAPIGKRVFWLHSQHYNKCYSKKNTTISDAQTKKTGSGEPTSADAHWINKQEKLKFDRRCLLLIFHCLFILLYMRSPSNACHCSLVPISLRWLVWTVLSITHTVEGLINLLSWVQSGKTLEGEKNTHEKEDVLKTLEDRIIGPTFPHERM